MAGPLALPLVGLDGQLQQAAGGSEGGVWAWQPLLKRYRSLAGRVPESAVSAGSVLWCMVRAVAIEGQAKDIVLHTTKMPPPEAAQAGSDAAAEPSSPTTTMARPSNPGARPGSSSRGDEEEEAKGEGGGGTMDDCQEAAGLTADRHRRSRSLCVCLP